MAQMASFDISDIEFRSDTLVYFVNSDQLATGQFCGGIGRFTKVADMFHSPSNISYLLYDYTNRLGGIYVEAYFNEGLATGKWIIYDFTRQWFCGYINVSNGYLHGESLFKCPHSQKSEISNYNKGIRDGVFVVTNNAGDTINHCRIIKDSAVYFKLPLLNYEKFPKANWCDE